MLCERRDARRPAFLFLQRGVVRLAGANADDPLDLGNEDLAVADLTGLGGLHDGFNNLIDQIAAYGYLDTGLGHEIDHVLRATVKLRMTALAAETLHLRDGHARNADIG